jgi:hypothetical protein
MKETPEFPEIRVLSMSKKQIGFMTFMMWIEFDSSPQGYTREAEAGRISRQIPFASYFKLAV